MTTEELEWLGEGEREADENNYLAWCEQAELDPETSRDDYEDFLVWGAEMKEE